MDRQQQIVRREADSISGSVSSLFERLEKYRIKQLPVQPDLPPDSSIDTIEENQNHVSNISIYEESITRSSNGK